MSINVGNFGDSADEQLRRRLEGVPLPNYTESSNPAMEKAPEVSSGDSDASSGGTGISSGGSAVRSGDTNKCPICEQGKLREIRYSTCSHCAAEIANAEQVAANAGVATGATVSSEAQPVAWANWKADALDWICDLEIGIAWNGFNVTLTKLDPESGKEVAFKASSNDGDGFTILLKALNKVIVSEGGKVITALPAPDVRSDAQEPVAAQPEEASISMSQFATKDDYYEAMEREHLGDADKRTGIYAAPSSPAGEKQ